jgi:DNA-directed RNA polymerase specialized sigma24 family protein
MYVMDHMLSSGPLAQQPQSEARTLREEAARQVFERYYEKLKALVHHQLASTRGKRIRGKIGTSDIVQDALKSFFENEPDLSNPDSLAAMLRTFTRRKALNTAKEFATQKRDLDLEQAEVAFDEEGSAISLWEVERMASDPSPEEAVSFVETLEGFLPHLEELSAISNQLSAER